MENTIEMTEDSDILNSLKKEKMVVQTYLNDTYPEQMKLERSEATYWELVLSYVEVLNKRKEEIINDTLSARRSVQILETVDSLSQLTNDAFSQAWEETLLLIKDNFQVYEVA